MAVSTRWSGDPGDPQMTRGHRGQVVTPDPCKGVRVTPPPRRGRHYTTNSEGKQLMLQESVIVTESIEDWARRKDLTRSTGTVCVLRLNGMRCRHCYDHGKCPQRGCPCRATVSGFLSHAVFDHASLWNRDGKPAVFVFQPYALDQSHMKYLMKLCQRFDLQFTISTSAAGHRPGETLMVEITRKEDSPWPPL